MAGHSKFKNIMHRKGAQDAKRGKLFTKLVREVFVAAKINPSEEFNPRLRSAVSAAKSSNVPKDRILEAIKKASSDKGGVDFQDIRYEGYSTGGVPIIVEALTDNKNRTASDVRSAFTKHGGNLGAAGSVSHMFDRTGVIYLKGEVATESEMMEFAIESDASDCILSGDLFQITCPPENFDSLLQKCQDKFENPEDSGVFWISKSPVLISDEAFEKMQKLIDALEQSDDVKNVFSGHEITQ